MLEFCMNENMKYDKLIEIEKLSGEADFLKVKLNRYPKPKTAFGEDLN